MNITRTQCARIPYSTFDDISRIRRIITKGYHFWTSVIPCLIDTVLKACSTPVDLTARPVRAKAQNGVTPLSAMNGGVNKISESQLLLEWAT